MRMRRPKSESQIAFRAEVSDWLQDIRRRTNLSFDQIGERSGINSATLYRWTDPKRTEAPSHSSLLAISEAFGIPMPGHRPSGKPAPGFHEAGVARLDPPEHELPPDPNQSWWRLKDRALELAGYLPGDQVLLDQSVAPQAGDGVIAQIYDFEIGAAETVARLFAFPVLVTRSADPLFAHSADLIDNARVKVMGTIIRMVRDRKRAS
jgi:transcriptional regulator with XRE-family HTH domain